MDLIEIFPEKIGFGARNFDSLAVACSTKTVGEYYAIADYFSKDGDLVYHIEIHDDFCRVNEYCNGREIGLTRANNLEEAFKQKFNSFQAFEHPRFCEVAKKIATNGNVYFQPISQNRFLFFPAGLIFILRLPIINDEVEKLITRKIEYKALPFDLKLEGVYKGTIIRLLNRDNEITYMEERPVADFSTTLYDLEESLRFLLSLNVVVEYSPEFVPYGLVVLEAAQAVPGSFMSHPGSHPNPGSTRGCRLYSVLLSRSGDLSLKRAIELYEDLISDNTI
jgi:hypothetical protein